MALFDDLAATDKLLLFNHKIDWVDSLPVARNEDAQAVPLPETEPLERECQHFLQCVASRNRPQTDGANGLRVLQVLEACQESLSRGGHPVAVSRDKDFFVHETSVIEPGCKIGSGTKIWHFSHVMAGAEIGCNCTLGQNSFVGSQAKIGSNVKIQNNVSLYQGVTLEDGVFCGPSAVFTNVINPRSHISRRREFQPTLVRKGATIGANATILCGITIGRYAFVAAGAVVTGDVPDHALVLGVPARLKGWVCHCGQRLSDVSLDCSRCGAVFERVGEGVRRRDESSPTRP
jgi:UDP-2-acetamido-3-amino-2,3-dideoxy-glucuronate N-acetyltransferase